ncbi:ATP-dependent RNA helicase dbp6 [Myotisia sp. PD_48]|nr:ATP-dependent RNA helicase dbp6 [Myotisia sp. PD_48]
MADTFYARYIPPSKPSTTTTHSGNDTGSILAPKRKRHEDHEEPSIQSPSAQKKPKKERSDPSLSRKMLSGENQPSSKDSEKNLSKQNSVDTNENASRHKEKIRSRSEEPQHQSDGKKRKKDKGREVAEVSDKLHGKPTDLVKTKKQTPGDSTESKTKSKKSRSKDGDEAAPGSTKHTKILSKYEKAKSRAADPTLLALNRSEAAPAEDVQPPEGTNFLEPLPQPAPVAESSAVPSYATLPPWIAAPSTAPSGLRLKFNDLGIDPKIVSVLEAKDYTEALPIQSTVIPLLTKGPARHSGDVCVSAATGSGKTLAYILPIVSTLERLTVPRLRAVIVVPTRELVKQARETCELCASGTGLRIGTAVGSTALKDEQAQLMEQSKVYQPDSKETGSSSGPSGISPEDWVKFDIQSYVTETEQYAKTIPFHTIKSSPCIDILICTPGRLVDHIRSTPGFSLQDIEWLVIDEADRLLNESFQEWVETVVPALEPHDGTNLVGQVSKFLAGLGVTTESRRVQKVILSATMTRDISKLNSLRLRNPKLVVIGQPDRPDATDQLHENGDVAIDGSIALPPSLTEMSIAVGDGSEKPLYLLNLLLSHIKVIASKSKPEKLKRNDSSSSDTSDSSESSDSSDPSNSSDSDTSDSDTETDSSSGSSTSSSGSDSSTSSTSSAKVSARFQNSVLVFTKSSEAATRLSRLLCLLHPAFESKIGTLVKSNKSSTSRKTISAYKKGDIQMIIATDRASRGLDLPLLGHVINYDVPNSMTSYVHRVGRTARAGQPGSAWTFVTHTEGRWFTNEIVRGNINRSSDGNAIRKINIRLDDAKDSPLKAKYSDALKQLGAEVEGVKRPVGQKGAVKV